MINQSSLSQFNASKAYTANLSNELPKTQDSIPKMLNHMIYCNKCEKFRGMTDEVTYYQCRVKHHKIMKEVKL